MIGLLAVLGHDVSRSLSPRIHHAASRALGWQLAYLPISAHDARDFEDKVDALRTLGALGANVTIPYKHDANTVCAERSEVARTIGAVNTLVFRSDGVIAGDNTDGPGFLEVLRERPVEQLEVVRVLGAGGSARAVAWAAREAGAGRVEIAARRAEKAQSVAEPFGATPVALDGGSAPTLVVSTLPPDARIADEAVERWIDASRSPRIYDLSYLGPDAPSPLVRASVAAGMEAEDGLSLLVEQGALSFTRWTGAVLGPVRQAMRDELWTRTPPP